MKKRGDDEEPPGAELARRRAKLVENLKESARFRHLLREAASQLRADAAKLPSGSDEQRRRLLLESANRMESYAADMEEKDAPSGIAPDGGGASKRGKR